MNFAKKGQLGVVYSIIILAIFLVVSGCSKEAKLERHWKKAEQYLAENKAKEAALEYRNVIKLEPKHAKAHYKLGLAYLRMGMFRDAYVEISKTVELDPGLLDARNHLGQLYFLSGDLKKAREQVEAVLAKDPANSSAHMLLSSAYLKEKKLDEAIVEGQKAVQGEQKMEAYLHLANLFLIKKDLPQA
jgi:Tfp pilus assembly protein PilF